jgi:hypothetical protein
MQSQSIYRKYQLVCFLEIVVSMSMADRDVSVGKGIFRRIGQQAMVG